MLHNLKIDDFIANYWQKSAFLIRQGLPGYHSPLSPEELAGLALEEDVESRIIIETPQHPYWTLEHGPFDESRFSKLPDKNWTLLIQGLNKLVTEYQDLLENFNFIPSWRIDDVMASYAVDGGSVGPHTDQYDVFLLQAYGTRKWMISDNAISNPEFIDELDVKVLKEFNHNKEWTLEPGDILYLPPGIPHHGVAVGDCITLSIGFRAPSYSELLLSFTEAVSKNLPEDLRYQDDFLSAPQHHGEITHTAIAQVKDILKNCLDKALNDDRLIQDWFGRFITDYLNDNTEFPGLRPDSDQSVISGFTNKIRSSSGLYRPSEIRANYIKSPGKGHKLYINSEEFYFESNYNLIIELFCDKNTFKDKDLETILRNKTYLDFIYQMYLNGFIEIINNDKHTGS